MKKITLLCILTITAYTPFAQFKKGEKIIETGVGDLIAYKTKSSTILGDNEGKLFDFIITSTGGYFVNPRIAVGTGINIFLSASSSASVNSNRVKISDDKGSFLQLGIYPFIRYYFHQNTRSRFYGQLEVGGISAFIFHKFTVNNYNDTTGALVSTNKIFDNPKNHLIIIIIPSVGWNYFFSPHTALNLNIGYPFSVKKPRPKALNYNGILALVLFFLKKM